MAVLCLAFLSSLQAAQPDVPAEEGISMVISVDPIEGLVLVEVSIGDGLDLDWEYPSYQVNGPVSGGGGGVWDLPGVVEIDVTGWPQGTYELLLDTPLGVLTGTFEL